MCFRYFGVEQVGAAGDMQTFLYVNVFDKQDRSIRNGRYLLFFNESEIFGKHLQWLQMCQEYM